MIRRLGHQAATGGEHICYGSTESLKAAKHGAVQVLLVKAGEEDNHAHIIATTFLHGGRVARVASKEVDELGCIALLVYEWCILDIDESVETTAPPHTEAGSTSLTPPLPMRTLTFFASAEAPVEPTVPTPTPTLQDELELLLAMFGDERRVRQLAPYDGTHFLLHVADTCQSTDDYLILEFHLPQQYPNALPLVTAPFGQLASRVLTDEEATAAAASCCARVGEDNLGGPVIFSMYDAAREWLLDAAAAA